MMIHVFTPHPMDNAISVHYSNLEHESAGQRFLHQQIFIFSLATSKAVASLVCSVEFLHVAELVVSR